MSLTELAAEGLETEEKLQRFLGRVCVCVCVWGGGGGKPQFNITSKELRYVM